MRVALSGSTNRVVCLCLSRLDRPLDERDENSFYSSVSLFLCEEVAEISSANRLLEKSDTIGHGDFALRKVAHKRDVPDALPLCNSDYRVAFPVTKLIVDENPIWIFVEKYAEHIASIRECLDCVSGLREYPRVFFFFELFFIFYDPDLHSSPPL